MLWGAALYNNGGYPYKDARFGESYSPDGVAQRPRRHHQIVTPPQMSPNAFRTARVSERSEPRA